MDGVFVDVLPELQGEEGVLTPGNGLYHMDLVLVRTQVTLKIGARFFSFGLTFILASDQGIF